MSNNEPSSVPGVTPNADLPVTGTPASPAGVTPQTKPTLTLEEALRELEETRRAHTNAKEEAKRHHSKLEKYEKAEKEAQDAQLSEIERVNKQYADLQAQHDTLATELQMTRVHQAVERYASKLNFVVPAEMIARLIDWTDVEYTDGRPTNVEKLLETLAKTAPDLVRKQVADPAQTPPARGNGTPALPAMNPGRSTITSPDALPPGKMSIQEAYASLRNKR